MSSELHAVREALLVALKNSTVEQQRYLTLRRTLSPFRGLPAGKRVLDFGASYALSMVVLLELGAREVLGVEPNEDRVRTGREVLLTGPAFRTKP